MPRLFQKPHSRLLGVTLALLLSSFAVGTIAASGVAVAPTDVTYTSRCLSVADAATITINPDQDYLLISCNDEDAWPTTCSVDNSCGPGTTTRNNIYCLDSTMLTVKYVDVSNSNSSLCKSDLPATSRSCLNVDGCGGGFEWQCALLPKESPTLNEDSVLWAPCDSAPVAFSKLSCGAACGTGKLNRAARCALMFDSDNIHATLPSFSHSYRRQNMLTSPCLLSAPVPELQRTCMSAACSAPSWYCNNPDDATGSWGSCYPEIGTKCQEYRCYDKKFTARRNVACMDGAGTLPLPDSACAGQTKPETVLDCAQNRADCVLLRTDADVCEVDGTAVTCLEESTTAFTTAPCVSTEDFRSVSSKMCQPSGCKLLACSAIADGATFEWVMDEDVPCPAKPTLLEESQFTLYTCAARTSQGDLLSSEVEPKLCVDVPASTNASFTKCTYDTTLSCKNGGVTVPIMRPNGVGQLARFGAFCDCKGPWTGADCATPLKAEITGFWFDLEINKLAFWLEYSADTGIFRMPSSQRPEHQHTVHLTLEPTDGSPAVTLARYEPNYADSLREDMYQVYKSMPLGLLGKTVSLRATIVLNNVTVATNVSTDAQFFGRSCGCETELCSTETGMCECPGDYGGENCEIEPCAAIGCNLATSTGCFVDPTTQLATCHCKKDSSGKALFTGKGCEQPVTKCNANGSKPDCANNGYYAARSDGSDALICNVKCSCAAPWTGDTCETCSKTCHNGGTIDAGCSKCKCKPGYSADSDCQCRFVTLRFTALMGKFATAWMTSTTKIDSDEAAAGLRKFLVSEIYKLTDLMKISLTIAAARIISTNGKKFTVEIDVTHEHSCSAGWTQTRPENQETLVISNPVLAYPLYAPRAEASRAVHKTFANNKNGFAVRSTVADSQILAAEPVRTMRSGPGVFQTLATTGYGGSVLTVYNGINNLRAAFGSDSTALADSGIDWLDTNSDLTITDAAAEAGDDVPKSVIAGSGTGSGGSDETTTIVLATVLSVVGVLIIVFLLVCYAKKLLCFKKSNRVADEDPESGSRGHTSATPRGDIQMMDV